ncbi:MAG: hypothetical protein JRF42_16605 [Deltaproteobacteria bacterium]|nr:hypothetical protein [Deltaproteobacteria bacterium]
MKISKLALIALLGSALMAFGCSDDASSSGGSGGSGGSAGSGGGGGTGGIVECAPQAAACSDSDVEAVVACCELPPPPDDADACTGDESLENPTECEATGTVVTYRVTMLSTARGCALGEDIDTCDGNTCAVGGLAQGDGEGGVDNGLYALNFVLDGGGLGNVGGVDQAFSDSFCGLTDGDEDEAVCNDPQEIPVLEMLVDVEANNDAGCANVTLTSDGASADLILNLGEVTEAGTVCASGTIGTIPIANGETAVTIANLLAEGAGALVAQVFDIQLDLSKDVSQGCDALSATFEIGGVAVENGAGGAGGAPAN